MIMQGCSLGDTLASIIASGSLISSCHDTSGIGFGSSAGRHACHHLLALLGCKTPPRSGQPNTAS